jgi:hypothetical protein
VLSVSSEFNSNSLSYSAENLKVCTKDNAWVAKSCGNEFVEIELARDASGRPYLLDRVELINLNTRAYKVSVCCESAGGGITFVADPVLHSQL